MNRRRNAIVAASALLLVSWVGCNSVLGLDDLELVDSDDATASGSGASGAGTPTGSTVASGSGGGAGATGGASASGGAGGGAGGLAGGGGGACIPTTCMAEGKDCGLVPDGCGVDLDCGGCNAPASCGGAGTPNVCGCTPTTCAAEGKDCGTIPDGCGATLDCGSCLAPQICGGTVANVCGDAPCVPTTCAALGKNCGVVSDGCASTIDCGTCVSPESCGGTGTSNVCGCLPTTCGAQGKNCGSIPDGCGGTVPCGSCASPQTCGGGGNPNVCGCTPTTCAAQGKNCGNISDGCGGTLACGSCVMPQTCGGGGTPNVCGSAVCSNVLTQTNASVPSTVSSSYPVYAASTPAGGTAVAWSAQAGGLFLSRFDAAGQPIGAPFTIPNGVAAHGIAVTADGYALLVQRNPDALALVKLDLGGVVVLDKLLVGLVDHSVVGNEWYAWGSWQNAGGRLAWTGSTYATYFPIQRLWPDMIAHFGDTLRFYQPDGTLAAGGWSWGCSHSLDVRLAHNGASLGPICLSDCYPQKAIMYNWTTLLVSSEPSGDCMGSSQAALGGLVPVSGGFWLTYSSPEGQASRNIALAHVSSAGALLSTTWLTSNAVQEDYAHLAAFQGGFLAGWREQPSTYHLLLLDPSGSPLGAPLTIAAALGKNDDFLAYPNGDVGWVLPNGAQLALVRFSACP